MKKPGMQPCSPPHLFNKSIFVKKKRAFEEKGSAFQIGGRNSKSQVTKEGGNSDQPTVPSAMVH